MITTKLEELKAAMYVTDAAYAQMTTKLEELEELKAAWLAAEAAEEDAASDAADVQYGMDAFWETEGSHYGSMGS